MKKLVRRRKLIYIFERYRQIGHADFNQMYGLKMSPAKPRRAALGALLIRKLFCFSVRELVEEITENPYLQYFIGLSGFQTVPTFAPTLLVEFCKRLNEDILSEINKMSIAYNAPNDPTRGCGSRVE